MRISPSEGTTDVSYQQHGAIIKELTRLGLYSKDIGWMPESQETYKRLLADKFGVNGKRPEGWEDGGGI